MGESSEAQVPAHLLILMSLLSQQLLVAAQTDTFLAAARAVHEFVLDGQRRRALGLLLFFRSSSSWIHGSTVKNNVCSSS